MRKKRKKNKLKILFFALVVFLDNQRILFIVSFHTLRYYSIMKIYLASGNKHKKKEMAELFPEHTIVIPSDENIEFDPEETGTTFEELYSLFLFDRQFRNIIFKHLLIIENNIKSIISYQLSKKYGIKEKDYLNPVNYDRSSDKSRQVNDLLKKIKRQKFCLFIITFQN